MPTKFTGCTKFTVRCAQCGHTNRPSPSPFEGVRLVLSGAFSRCLECDAEFVEIRVPRRPLVDKLLAILGGKISPKVQIFPYSGKVPRAKGVVKSVV